LSKGRKKGRKFVYYSQGTEGRRKEGGEIVDRLSRKGGGGVRSQKKKKKKKKKKTPTTQREREKGRNTPYGKKTNSSLKRKEEKNI